MHTLSFIRKPIFLAIFLALLAFPTITRVEAQVSQPATSSQVDELRNTLITLLTQMIAQLQSQIAELIAQQANTQTQLGVVQDQVKTVVSQTAPKVVASTTTITIPPPLTLGERIALRKKVCSSQEVPGNSPVISSWFKSLADSQLTMNEKDLTETGYYNTGQQIDRWIFSWHDGLIRQSLDPINESTPIDPMKLCDFVKGSTGDEFRKVGCLKFVEIQTPYLSCMKTL